MQYVKYWLLFLLATCCLLVPARAQAADVLELRRVSQQVQQLVPHIRERTVAIRITIGDKTGFGSGAIISADGLILTCAHVAELSENLVVITSDNKEYKAKRLGMNALNDYAMLQIEEQNLPFFALGNSTALKILQWVIGAGHPGGPYPDVEPAIAIGRIRGFHKKLPIQFGAKFYDDAIQTDVPIFAGNSGGPLIDLEGRLIGINGAITLVNDLAFAIPINEIKADLTTLQKGKDAEGHQITDWWQVFQELQEDMSLDEMLQMFRDTPLGKIIELLGGDLSVPSSPKPVLGVIFDDHGQGKITVTEVKVNSIGSLAGFRPDDEIISVDNKKFTSLNELEDYFDELEKWEEPRVELLRNKIRQHLVVYWQRSKYSRNRCLDQCFLANGLQLKEVTVQIWTEGRQLGYGVVISPDGWVLTNYYLVKDLPRVQVQFQTSGLRSAVAQVVGKDGVLDVALLKLADAEGLKAIRMGDDKKLRIGEWVISGGSETGILQAGMVSALARQVPTNRKIPTLGILGILSKVNKSPVRAYQEVIQHDSSIEVHQFGTPLVNEQGELVGINVGHFYRGTTFAIPISAIMARLDDLKAGKPVVVPPEFLPYEPEMDPFAKLLQYFLKPHNKNTEPLGKVLHDVWQHFVGKPQKKEQGGFLGVQVRETAQGIEITEVMAGYAAEKAGLQQGDIIVEIDKQKVESLVSLLERLQNLAPGTKIDISVLRKENGSLVTKPFMVTLDQRP
jgi:S1-C subfamily serine protease